VLALVAPILASRSQWLARLVPKWLVPDPGRRDAAAPEAA
jgi:hypothetical protein